jgi:class 3 adenylate cyclase
VIDELALALSLDENDSDVHRVLAAVNLSIHRDHDKALHHQERALALNPNDDLIVVQQGEVYSRRACRVALPVRAISRCDVSRLLAARAGSKEVDGDLMGDGVNIAARLEGIAAPTAICLSEDAYRQVKGRLDLAVTG